MGRTGEAARPWWAVRPRSAGVRVRRRPCAPGWHDHWLRYGRRPPSIANESRPRSSATAVRWSGPAPPDGHGPARAPGPSSRPACPVAGSPAGRHAGPSMPAARRRAPATPAGTGPWCDRPAASGFAGRARPPCAPAACTPARQRCRRSRAGRARPRHRRCGRRPAEGHGTHRAGAIDPGAVVRLHVAACGPTVLWSSRPSRPRRPRPAGCSPSPAGCPPGPAAPSPRPARRRRPCPARSRPARRWPASAPR